MHVASLELCRELFELSGWNDAGVVEWFDGTPRYDLGYLLRKLPKYIPAQHERKKQLNIRTVANGYAHYDGWYVGYLHQDRVDRDFEDKQNDAILGRSKYLFYGDSLEDTVARMAIGLFNQGVLTKE